MKPIALHMEQTGISLDKLVAATAFEARTVKAIVRGNYAASPLQRERLAAALGVSAGEISWGHAVPVEYMRGNEPKSGPSI